MKAWKARQQLFQVLVTLLSTLFRKHSRWVLRLLHVQIQQVGFMILKESMQTFLKKSRKLREQDLQNMLLQGLQLNIMKDVEYGRLNVISLFHVLHRMNYLSMMLSSQQQTDVKLFVKVLICLQQLMQQNTYRKTAYGSLVVRLLMQVVLLHQLLKCHRTAKDFHGHLKKLTLNYRISW